MNRTDAPVKQSTPFAVNGQREPILPTTPAGDNTASYSDGFPAITMTLKSAGGLPPKGQDMNQILYELSNLARWASSGALNAWDADFSAAISGYPKGAILLGTDGTTIYISNIDANTNNPNTTSTGWLNLSKITAIAALAGGANKLPYFSGTNTAAQTDITSVGRDIIGKADIAAVLTYLGLQSSYVDTAGKMALNGGWGLGIRADQMAAAMASLTVTRFDYFDPADNIGPYPGQWSGGISFANSGVTGWQIVGASLGDKPDFSARIKNGQTSFSDWVQFYHTGHKPTATDVGALAKVSNLSDVSDKITARTNLGLGTAATKAVGVGSGQVPDMASFASGAGWQILPGGTIIQWGQATSGQIGDPLTVNFPIAFTQYQNAQVVATYDNAAATTAPYSFAAQPISNTQFKLLNSTQSANLIYARWIAIGK